MSNRFELPTKVKTKTNNKTKTNKDKHNHTPVLSHYTHSKLSIVLKPEAHPSNFRGK